jgi:manganese transport protein
MTDGIPTASSSPRALDYDAAIEPAGHRSLEDVHRTVHIPQTGGWLGRLMAFAGPAYLVSVGYMDPGNWATDLQAGAEHKYGLLWVVAAASLMAIVLQVCSARLGVVTGKDLAQACRDYYPKWTRWPNWLGCELAIGACDLAEVLGSAVAIKLLFGIPLFWAVLITAADVLLLVSLQGLGMRLIEAFILVLVATISVCYAIEIFVLPQTRPGFMEMARAMAHPSLGAPGMVILAIGIIGATVMPHNLYLHGALVQTRKFQADERSIRSAIKYNTLDSVVALTLAFLVNAAILVMAANVFFGKSSVTLHDGRLVTFGNDWIQEAYLTLAPLLNAKSAGIIFAIALLASGLSSTVTGTLAGQVVMEGFMHWRMRPWLRRMITRVAAILPAVIVIGIKGDNSVNELITLSQVILGIQLPFAMIPLLQFTSSKARMGKFVNGKFLLIAGWTCCVLITALDVYGLVVTIVGMVKGT